MSKLLLHTCCAPCLTAVDQQLTQEAVAFDLFWFNPQIHPELEYNRRLQELERYATLREHHLINGHTNLDTDLAQWQKRAVIYRDEKEGGRRCQECLIYRLEQTVRYALANGYQAFTTTLTVSPHKNSNLISQIGRHLAEQYHLPYLDYDFKKQNGYQNSITLSKQYELYRQNYCGCQFSYQEMLQRSAKIAV